MRFFKHLSLIVLSLIAAVVLTVGLSHKLQRHFEALGWIYGQARYGDLYGFSSLRKFKEYDLGQTDALQNSDKPVKRYCNVDLYTIGDSFTTMDTSFYAGDKNYHVWLEVNVDTVIPDPKKRSVLVIEIIERNIQLRLKANYRKVFFGQGFQVKVGNRPSPPVSQHSEGYSFWFSQFTEQTNHRLEYLLSNFRLVLLIKELKAEMMLSLFGRTHPGATISKNHEYLFYDAEASRKHTLSSFSALPRSSIDTVVTNMNAIRRHYLGLGFDDVYFCMIPNKVTVCEPGRFKYNDQIERIEQHPDLEVPVLEIRKMVNSHPEYFHKGDGHWNARGKRVWLRTVNKLVETLANESENRPQKSTHPAQPPNNVMKNDHPELFDIFASQHAK